jgi:hypothetical protein
MNLRPDFVKHLSKQIREAEKREISLLKNGGKNKVLPRPSLKNNFLSSNGSPTLADSSKSEQSFFDLLSTNTGLSQFLVWVMQKCRAADLLSTSANTMTTVAEKETGSTEFQRIDMLLENLALDEYRLMNLFTYIYLEVYEYKIYELFEIYELKPNMKLHCKQFYLIVAFTSAFESNQMLEFFFIFGRILFSILSGYRETVYGVRLKQFAKLVGFPEKVLFKTFSDLGIIEKDEYDFELFELLFFALFEEREMLQQSQDRTNSQEKLAIAPQHGTTTNDPRLAKPTKKESKYKTCKGLCSIF